MIGEREERMLKFTWFEILKRPFSAFIIYGQKTLTIEEIAI